MSVQTENSLFMFSPLTKHAEFYQELFRGVSDYNRLGNRLIYLSEQAHAFRQYDKLRELALILSNSPLENHQIIGQYYLALGMCSKGAGAIETTHSTLESLASIAPSRYRARSLLLLSAINQVKNNDNEAYKLYREAIRVDGLGCATVLALQGMAVLKAKEGHHKHALKDLEALYPLARYAPAHIYFDYLNSYAVELAEAGRKQEARNISQRVLASPLAVAYSEWQNTASELKEFNRSFVTVPEIKSQPVEPQKPVSESRRPASVLSFPKLKEVPLPERPEKVKPREVGEMTAGEKRDLLLAALRTNTIRENEYNKLLFMCGLVESGPAVNVIDLEDETVLDNLMVEWANMVEPERLVAVLSALRDCEDDSRRNDILERMIRKAFEESRTCGLTESEWRLKVECKLPEK